MSRAAAFFDLDRTLIAGSSAFEFARAAAKAGLISRRDLLRGARDNLKFRLRGSTDEETAALRDQVFSMLEGVRVRDLQRLAPDILAGLLPRVYPEVLAVAYRHQDEGRPVYVCTAASQEMAELVAHVLTFDGAIGSRSEVVDGLYTGRPAGPFTYREGKAEAMRDEAERSGLDLAESWAYSDSESDLPMLRAVGHPVAVNPDKPLLALARSEGWEVVRHDKLPQRLRVGGAVAVAAAVGGAGTVAIRGRPPIRRGRAPAVAARATRAAVKPTSKAARRAAPAAKRATPAAKDAAARTAKR